MSPNSSDPQSERKETDQAVIERALAGMSAAELVDLRTTAHRLKHLPFTRLVEALFFQTAARQEGSAEKHDGEPEYNFAGEQNEYSRSDFVRELFRQIEQAFATKTRSDEFELQG